MKHLSWGPLFIIAATSLFYGCAPGNNFAGAWIMNIGKVNFVQNGNLLTGVIAGYGGNWNETFQGTINGNEAAFSTDWFGDFTLVLEGDRIKSKSPDLSFCGIRSAVTEELPKGCGFSGKWNLPSNNFYPDGTYILLTQTAQDVSGNIYDSNGKILDAITGSVNWGKGWRMNGTTNLDPVTLNMNSAETGFEIMFDPSNKSHLCAVREGQTSAYLGYFTCQP